LSRIYDGFFAVMLTHISMVKVNKRKKECRWMRVDWTIIYGTFFRAH